jgi:hypothetical protein
MFLLHSSYLINVFSRSLSHYQLNATVGSHANTTKIMNLKLTFFNKFSLFEDC